MKFILVGFKNCGKTFLGQFLADHLLVPFIDIDRQIEKKHTQKTQEVLSFYEIFHTYGEEVFRAYEKACIAELKPLEDVVIATGGGSLLDPDSRQVLQKIGTVIYLKASKKTLLARMQEDRIPEFLDLHDLIHSFERAFEARKEIYEKMADIQIRVDGKNPMQILEELQELLLKEAIVG